MNDVLKSWAVPKGVPLQRGERHSAFPTEDHPLEYLRFEGIIPKGQYGGGTVMVWDIGNYEPVEGNYYKGELMVFLTGRKLKGEWLLKRKIRKLRKRPPHPDPLPSEGEREKAQEAAEPSRGK